MSDLENWLAELGRELDAQIADPDDLLAFTAEIAHGVTRPAAPLSVFLVGLAAGRAGGGEQDVAAALSAARSVLARRLDP